MAEKNVAVKNVGGRPRKIFDRNIAKDRLVSKFHLDDAAEEQAANYGWWSDTAVTYKKKKDNMDLDLMIKMGEKNTYFRETLNGGVDSKGNTKAPTKDQVDSAVNTDEEIVAMKRAIIDQEELCGLLQSAIKALDQRRSMIKVLEELYAKEFWDRELRENDEAVVSRNNNSATTSKKKKMADKMKTMKDPVEQVDEGVVEDDNPREMGDPLPVKALFNSEDEENEILEDEPEPEEEAVEAKKPKAPKKEPEKKASKTEGECPSGHRFGVDFGQFDDDCDECAKEGACFTASKKLREEK